MKKKILVVGFGNEFCGDDILGPWVIKLLKESKGIKFNAPTYRVDLKTARHLDFSWAEVLAGYQHLIFVDASPHKGYPLVKIKKLASTPGRRPFTSHHISISHLLQITQELFGQQPSAYLVAIRGEIFDFGEELSPGGRKAAPQAVKKILSLIKDLAPAS
jgi:hydrogenase maturation protease